MRHYRFIATLGIKTSEISQKHDGKIDSDTGKPHNVVSAKHGFNILPLHPNCRSTIVAVVYGEMVEGLQRAACDPKTGKTDMVPADMTYPE